MALISAEPRMQSTSSRVFSGVAGHLGDRQLGARKPILSFLTISKSNTELKPSGADPWICIRGSAPPFSIPFPFSVSPSLLSHSPYKQAPLNQLGDLGERYKPYTE